MWIWCRLNFFIRNVIGSCLKTYTPSNKKMCLKHTVNLLLYCPTFGLLSSSNLLCASIHFHSKFYCFLFYCFTFFSSAFYGFLCMSIDFCVQMKSLLKLFRFWNKIKRTNPFLFSNMINFTCVLTTIQWWFQAVVRTKKWRKWKDKMGERIDACVHFDGLC